MEFEKPSMGTSFIAGGAFILWFINTKNIDPSGILTTLSGIFLTFPLLLLTIFVISSLRKSIKKSYQTERKSINKNIEELRRKQDNKKLSIDELIKIDGKISDIRRNLLNYPNNRFEKMIVKSITLLTLTMLTFSLNLGLYLDYSSIILGTISFIWGIYYIAEMIADLFYCL